MRDMAHFPVVSRFFQLCAIAKAFSDFVRSLTRCFLRVTVAAAVGLEILVVGSLGGAAVTWTSVAMAGTKVVVVTKVVAAGTTTVAVPVMIVIVVIVTVVTAPLCEESALEPSHDSHTGQRRACWSIAAGPLLHHCDGSYNHARVRL